MSLAVLTYAWCEPQGKHNDKYVYGPEDVRLLQRMVARHLSVPHDFVVVTDRPEAFADDNGRPWEGIRVILIDWTTHVPGKCYVRLMTFHPEGRALFGADRVLQMDLDTVVVGSLDPIVDRSEDLVLWHNPRRVPWETPRMGARSPYYNGSMLLHRCGSMPEVWREFDPKNPGAKDDQWLFSARFGAGMPYWDGERDGVYRLEHPDLPGSGVGAALPENARVVFFPGEARKPWLPEMMAQYPWIAEHRRMTVEAEDFPPVPVWAKAGASFECLGDLWHVRGVVDDRVVARRWRAEKKRWHYDVLGPSFFIANKDDIRLRCAGST